ncbi:MAG: tRNA lysidine(34) synthetase TilS [Thalassolituus sp.]
MYLACSGGLDSYLMLLLASAVPELRSRLQVIHVNHGLSPNADQWQSQVDDLCRSLKVPCHAHRVEINPSGEGLEAAARTARYQVFESVVPANGVLLLAQHGSDQAETLLLRLARGAGLHGLRGMSASRTLTSKQGESRCVLRPWLTLSRDCLERAMTAMVGEASQPWIEDESNRDLTFDRNWVRYRLIPEFRGRYPQIEQSLLTSVGRLNDDYQLLQFYMTPALEASLSDCEWPATYAKRLSLSALSDAPDEARIHFLRHWFEVCGQSLPQGEAVVHWLEQCLNAAEDKAPRLSVGRGVLQRYRGHVYMWVEQNAPEAVDHVPAPWVDWHLSAKNGHNLPTGWKIAAAGLHPGVVIQQSARPSRPIKKIWQDAGTPPWVREYWPILEFEGEPVALLGSLNGYSPNCELIDSLGLEFTCGAIGRPVPE